MPTTRVRPGPANGAAAFTLLEILVSVTLLVVIMTVTASLIDVSTRVMKKSTADVEAFQGARDAFQAMTSRLSQATLNTYWDYYDSGGQPYRLSSSPSAFEPARYGRYADLHFICGKAVDLLPTLPPDVSQLAGDAVFFAAPLGTTAEDNYKGLPGLMTVCGFFLAFGSDASERPGIMTGPASYRWRLMELRQPTESLEVFQATRGNDWFTGSTADGEIHPLADNIIALVIWPRRSVEDDPQGDDLTTDYTYDSRTDEPWSGSPPHQPVQAHQLPPTLQVTMVAIDEGSALRMEEGSAPPAKISAALSGLFQGSVANYEKDFQTLTARLDDSKVHYRVFSTTIHLKESRWSE